MLRRAPIVPAKKSMPWPAARPWHARRLLVANLSEHQRSRGKCFSVSSLCPDPVLLVIDADEDRRPTQRSDEPNVLS